MQIKLSKEGKNSCSLFYVWEFQLFVMVSADGQDQAIGNGVHLIMVFFFSVDSY